MIFEIQNTIVSGELLTEEFACNISACKGACCIKGDAGAPVSQEEINTLEEIYPKVKHFLRPEGIKSIETQGTSVKGSDGEHETPLVNGKECAYVTFDDKGVALCGIEQAQHSGEIAWKKPISCHLYPVRIKEYKQFRGVNYDRWDICSDACELGASTKTPVYKFLKEPLINHFGQEWYDELCIIAENYL